MHAPIYTNEFIILVAGPSVGKSIPIRYATRLWRTAGVSVGAVNVSKASLLDELEEAIHRVSIGATQQTYHSLSLGIPEFGNFVKGWDDDLMNTLNELYDCADEMTERKRHRGTKTILKHVQLTLLSGVQPEYLSKLLPATAWAYGFPSRCLFVYSSEKRKPLIFENARIEESRISNLSYDLQQIKKLKGEFAFTSEALIAIQDWYDGDMEPQPTHAKLRYYNGRRLVHFMKLLMIVSVARGNSLVIDNDTFEYTRSLMLEMEEEIPNIFKEITYSDATATMEDLRHFVLAESTKGEVEREEIQKFLLGRMAHNQVDDFLRMACAAGYLRYNSGSFRAVFDS